MNKNHYEIEIKSLLGTKENADILVGNMKAKDPGFQELGSHKQLNHYFQGGDLEKLYAKVESHLGEDKRSQFKDIAERFLSFQLCL